MNGPNRRRFLQAASVATVATVAGCFVPSSDGAHPVTDAVTDWPSFRGDQYNTGYAKGVPATGSTPSTRWTVDTGGAIWGSPAVVDGSVYIGSSDGLVYAIDAATGTVDWTFETGHRIEGTPAVADDTVYVGSYDTTFYAIDAETGDQRWVHETDALIRGSPTVVDDTVYVGAGCHRLACTWYAEEADVTEDGTVYALEAETGDVVWRHDVDDEAVSTPAVAGETVFVGSSDGSLYALDAADGAVTWVYEVDDLIWSSPAVAFATVYVADWDGLVHAVDAGTGEAVWTADTDGHYVSASVAVDETTAYVGMTPANYPEPGINYGEVIAYDRESGAERWRYETDATEIGSSAVVTDDRLYFGTHQPFERDGNGVHALTTDGEPVWFMPVGGRGVGSSPALVDGVLYVGGTDGSVYAVE